MAAATSDSTSAMHKHSHHSIPDPISTTSPSSPASSISSHNSSRTRSTMKKQRTFNHARKQTEHTQGQERSRSSSPSLVSSGSTPEASPSPTTTGFAQPSLGPYNVILQSIIDAVDSEPLNHKDLPGSIELEPSPDVMRRLISLYMRYSHPLHRIVNENDPEFWTRLDHPMKPEVASVVYAMCTVGAILKSKAPSSGYLDNLVYYFYNKTLALIEERPKDITTIQTLLIVQNFHVVTHRTTKGSEACLQMMEIANSISLGETVMKIAKNGMMSQEDLIMRNTWRMLIWNETLANMISLKNGVVDPLKDLSSPALEYRPEEKPHLKSTATEAAYFHFASLLRIFQNITKIKLPMSPRDLHPVTSALDAFTLWHNNLPKNLRCNPRAGGTATLSSHATNLDLYFRLGHILLLNILPPSVRSSPTGLGPRRESPLRILATCANGITAAMGDLIKEPDLRSYCMVHGMRCLTEAAMIQLLNSKVPDPAISTPAKVNFMKTLWCIKQFNFAVPAEILNSALAPYDAAMKQNITVQRQDQRLPDKDVSRNRTPSISAMTAESHTLSATRRELSLASDYSSSTCSTREGSHMTICEADDIDREQSHLLPSSPIQDGAAASLLTLSLESPTVNQRGFVTESSVIQAMPLDARNLASAYDTTRGGDSKPVVHASKAETFKRDGPSSSSMALLIPKLEQPDGGSFHALDTHTQRSTQSKQAPGYELHYERQYPNSSTDPVVRSPSSHMDHSWHGQSTGSREHYKTEHGNELAYTSDSRNIEENRPPDGERSTASRKPTRRVSQTSTTNDEFGVFRSLQARVSHRSSPDHMYQEPHDLRRSLRDSPGANSTQSRHHLGRVGYESIPQDCFSTPECTHQGDMTQRTGAQTSQSNTNIPSHSYSSFHDKSPRTPIPANSDVGLHDGYSDSDLEKRDLRHLGSRQDSHNRQGSPPNQRARVGYDYIYQHHQQSQMQSHRDSIHRLERPKEYEEREAEAIPDHLPKANRKTTALLDPRDLTVSTRVAGHKRPSVSMYGLNGSDDGRGSLVAGDAIDRIESLQFTSPNYYSDPLHQDGADAARLRLLKHENLDRSARPEYKPHSHPNRTKHLRHTTARHSHVGHDMPIHAPYITESLPSPLIQPPYNYPSNSPRHQIPQQHSHQPYVQQHYSYQQPTSSSSHHHQRNPLRNQSGQQHEPRTSPTSITPPSSLQSHPHGYSSSSAYAASRLAHSQSYSERPTQHQLQDQYWHQQQLQHHREHDQALHVQQQERSRGMMPPPPPPLEWPSDTRVSSIGVYGEEDGPSTELTELLREPIRRKYR
ncbi:hypothetical protein BGX27_003348 [Mortierella sp. AM989]|nr:hypothetical protein BGX27_003348 [Mortierella sp. AM989]